MHPQFLHLHLPFHLPVIGNEFILYSYGLMMVFAFLGTQWLSSRLAKAKGINPEIFVNVTLISLVSGVIGARISHILENFKHFTDPRLTAWENIGDMLNIRSGGLTFYGGFILAAPIVLVYLLYNKVTARLAMDITAPCLMLGLAIGRIGCFLNGCCYGAAANVPWAVSFPYYSNAYIDDVNHDLIKPPSELRYPPVGEHYRLVSPDEIQQGYVLTGDPLYPKEPLAANVKALAAAEHSLPVHPAQIYSTITSLLLTALLLAYFFMPHTGGRVFALMLMLEGPSRFLLEMLRVEPPVVGNLSLSMVIGVILFAIGIVLWIGLGTVKDPTPAFPAPQPA